MFVQQLWGYENEPQTAYAIRMKFKKSLCSNIFLKYDPIPIFCSVLYCEAPFAAH